MVLYDVRGRPFPVSAQEWSAALFLALKFGWKPAGTVSPPHCVGRAAEPQWSGAYEIPAGQAVTRADAAALASALSKAAEHHAAAAIEPLIAFCRRSGFIICEDAADISQDLLKLSTAVGQKTPVKEPSGQPASV